MFTTLYLHNQKCYSNEDRRFWKSALNYIRKHRYVAILPLLTSAIGGTPKIAPRTWINDRQMAVHPVVCTSRELDYCMLPSSGWDSRTTRHKWSSGEPSLRSVKVGAPFWYAVISTSPAVKVTDRNPKYLSILTLLDVFFGDIATRLSVFLYMICH